MPVAKEPIITAAILPLDNFRVLDSLFQPDTSRQVQQGSVGPEIIQVRRSQMETAAPLSAEHK